MTQPGANPTPDLPQWPDAILDRIQRVFDYHQQTKLTDEMVRGQPPPDLKAQPALFRTFSQDVKIALPTNLPAADAPTVSLLAEGAASLPESQLNPPHDLRTLAAWLFYSDGLIGREQRGIHAKWQRTLPSLSGTYPCEIYVAASAIEGLDPGLYYYSPREFALFRLREGLGVMSHLKRGRPDLEFLKSAPAAVLVSTVFARSTWAFQARGYRAALLDAGHLVENLMQSGAALGMQCTARLRMNDSATRELIGVPRDVKFDHAEVVQAMVAWSNPLQSPPALTSAIELAPIPRAATESPQPAYDSIPAIHEDCVAPGVAIRDLRPPLTELSAVAPETPAYQREPIEPPSGGKALGPMIMKRRPLRAYARRAIPRDPFLALNRLALRAPAYPPLVPEFPHASIVRPLWFVHDVLGLDPGIWYYHPPTDRWSLLTRGDYRLESTYLCGDNRHAGAASAVCVLMANIHLLLMAAGPDTYRLAHLEAGIVAHRMQLLAEAQNLYAVCNATFYDEELRKFFGVQNGGWEPIYQIIVGYSIDADADVVTVQLNEKGEPVWRG